MYVVFDRGEIMSYSFATVEEQYEAAKRHRKLHPLHEVLLQRFGGPTPYMVACADCEMPELKEDQ